MIYNRHFHMVVTRRKDSKVLQFISMLRIADIVGVSRCKRQNMMTVKCSSDISRYQNHIDAVDR
eukprot:5427160-Ditylum_brightwellii.AAC.2